MKRNLIKTATALILFFVVITQARATQLPSLLVTINGSLLTSVGVENGFDFSQMKIKTVSVTNKSLFRQFGLSETDYVLVFELLDNALEFVPIKANSSLEPKAIFFAGSLVANLASAPAHLFVDQFTITPGSAAVGTMFDGVTGVMTATTHKMGNFSDVGKLTLSGIQVIVTGAGVDSNMQPALLTLRISGAKLYKPMQ